MYIFTQDHKYVQSVCILGISPHFSILKTQRVQAPEPVFRWRCKREVAVTHLDCFTPAPKPSRVKYM